MTHERATALAIKALQLQIKRLAVNANLRDSYASDAPMCVEASRQRQELRQAVEALERAKRIKAQRKEQQAKQEELTF